MKELFPADDKQFNPANLYGMRYNHSDNKDADINEEHLDLVFGPDRWILIRDDGPKPLFKDVERKFRIWLTNDNLIRFISPKSWID